MKTTAWLWVKFMLQPWCNAMKFTFVCTCGKIQ
jgi:hypothetical protein